MNLILWLYMKKICIKRGNMRLKILLKSEKGHLKIPFNYNHILSAIIYNKIADLELSHKIHASHSYKFFTFSQLHIHKFKSVKDGFISQNGTIDFLISSPDDYLIKSLVEGFLDDLTVDFAGRKLIIQKVELLPVPEFEEKIKVKTLSPIITRTKKEVDGEMKIWDLAPGDHFFKNLENNLINKYIKFNDIDKTDKNIKIYSEFNNVKSKRIVIDKGETQTYHRAYMMDLILEGDIDLLKFAYDTGVGEKSALGFGMIKVVF